MKLYIPVILYILVNQLSVKSAEVSNNEGKCHSLKVHGKHHIKHVIMNGLNRPYQLAMYPHEHTIFFSYNEGKDDEDTFGIAYVQINDTEPTNIKDIKDGFAIAIDEETKVVYFGSSQGIYEKHLTKSNITLILEGYDIWDMFFHHHLYFITYPSMRLHKYHSEHKNVTRHELIHERIYQFAIDGKNNVFITTVQGLFMIKEDEMGRIPIEGPKQFRAIEVNRAGVAHFCANNSIYVLHDTEHKLVEIAEIKDVFGLTFDGDDHFIYSNAHEIVKLVPGECEKKKEETNKDENKKKKP